jgi:hypothetical protein
VATTEAKRLIYPPGEAADLLGMTTRRLADLIRERRYSFTEILPGGKPGDRGRNRWGLTIAQIEAIVRGQAKIPPDLANLPQAGKTRLSPVSPDGKSRLRKSPVRR